MYTMSKKYSEDERLWTDWMRTVCVKDWGCVKDRSETVLRITKNIENRPKNVEKWSIDRTLTQSGPVRHGFQTDGTLARLRGTRNIQSRPEKDGYRTDRTLSRLRGRRSIKSRQVRPRKDGDGTPLRIWSPRSIRSRYVRPGKDENGTLLRL